MKPLELSNRIEFIKDWMINHNGHIDILDSEFVDAYTNEFNSKIKIQFFGANTCPELGKVLSQAYKQGIFSRFIISIIEHEPGFPNWVYTYELPITSRERNYKMELKFDPNKMTEDFHNATKIFVRALTPDGKWDSANIAQLDEKSLLQF
jgi:hypothetical protein